MDGVLTQDYFHFSVHWSLRSEHGYDLQCISPDRYHQSGRSGSGDGSAIGAAIFIPEILTLSSDS
jgi:hypothetical protein